MVQRVMQGKCKYPDCKSPAVCFWRQKAVCTAHYLLLRKFYSVQVRARNRELRAQYGN